MEFDTYEGTNIYVKCPRCGAGDICAVGWCFFYDAGKGLTGEEKQRQKEFQENQDQHYASQIQGRIEIAVSVGDGYEKFDLKSLPCKDGSVNSYETTITKAIKCIHNPEIRKILEDEWEEGKKKINERRSKYEEILESVEKVKTGELMAMFVNPLIGFAEEFWEITKDQAEKLRELLKKNYDIHQDGLEKRETHDIEFENVLDEIKEGKLENVNFNDYQHLDDDDKRLLKNANYLVKKIKSDKNFYKGLGKKYSLNNSDEKEWWQLWIMRNGKSDEERTKLEDILNYWKDKEKKEDVLQKNNDFPWLPVTIGGGLFLVLGLLVYYIGRKKRVER